MKDPALQSGKGSAMLALPKPRLGEGGALT